MRKSDLKTGFIVKFRNGKGRKVMLGTVNGDILVDGFGQHTGNLSSYSDDLVYQNGSNDWDIIEVYNVHTMDMFGFNFDEDEIIWTRTDTSAQNKEVIDDIVLKILISELFR